MSARLIPLPLRIWALIPMLAFSAAAADGYVLSGPVRLATATCSEFPWVSDLPRCRETAKLARKAACEAFGLPEREVGVWEDGSAGEFLAWAETLARTGDGRETLIFYFATHQLDDGRCRFSDGEDLPASRLIETVNRLAEKRRRVLFIHDACHGAAIERHGRFAENVIRVYASGADEEAVNMDFSKGPYGVAAFSAAPRAWMEERLGWRPRGMTFLGLVCVKAGLELGRRESPAIRLQDAMAAVLQARDEYRGEVRQRRVQTVEIRPAKADFELFMRAAADGGRNRP